MFMREPKVGFLAEDTPAGGGDTGVLARWYRRLRGIVRGKEPASRSFRYVSRLIEREFPASESGVCLAFTSSDSDQATTDALLMLAYCLRNELDSRVLVIDARFRDTASGLSGRLGLLDAPGFVEVLRDGFESNASLIHSTAVAGVDVLPAGGARGGGSTPVDRDKLRGLLDAVMARYDHVLVGVGSVMHDTRHIQTVAEADAVFLLARENKTFLKSLDDCRKQLQSSGVADVRVLVTA
jgi:hypothetical protein